MSTSTPTAPATPPLTPSLCFNTTYLRDFLRLSRAHLDDPITTHLNSLQTPSLTTPFNPLSTSDPSTNRHFRRQLPTDTCTSLLHSTIFPTWSARQQLINYCTLVATSPDPDDPDKSLIEAQMIADSHRVVNERLDPYSARFFPPREPRTVVLAGIMRNENAVEEIVRERTWSILKERCVGVGVEGKGWREELRRWEEAQRR